MLDPHGELLMELYAENLPAFEKIQRIATDLLQCKLQETCVSITTLASRVKTATSLEGKIEKKGHKYSDLSDITDLVGLRVITLYSDDVDKVAALVGGLFDVDWGNSVDRRKAHDLDSFGYNSLHYICSLRPAHCPEGEEHLTQWRFEVQMRSTLQHVWSEVEHDIGYKTSFGLQPEHRRMFGRLSGMLELIDDEFCRIRRHVTEYNRHMEELVGQGHLSEVALTHGSFEKYLLTRPFASLMDGIVAINQAEVMPTSLTPYVWIMQKMGLETLGDIDKMVCDYSSAALHYVRHQMSVTDLDIVSEALPLQTLLKVKVVKENGTPAEMCRLLDEIFAPNKFSEQAAVSVMDDIAAHTNSL